MLSWVKTWSFEFTGISGAYLHHERYKIFYCNTFQWKKDLMENFTFINQATMTSNCNTRSHPRAKESHMSHESLCWECRLCGNGLFNLLYDSEVGLKFIITCCLILKVACTVYTNNLLYELPEEFLLYCNLENTWIVLRAWCNHLGSAYFPFHRIIFSFFF